MNMRDFFEWSFDFIGDLVFSATKGSNVGHPFTVTVTAASGTPTIAVVDGSANGETRMVFTNNAQVENLCMSFGDTLCLGIDNIREIEFRVKMNQAALDATTQLAFGLVGDRHDSIDSIAQAALFRVIGADDTTAVVVETDDGTTDNNDVATGQTLTNAYKTFVINFADKSDVKFFIDGQPVAQSTTFDMSAYSGSLQPFIQFQKTANANQNGATVDYVKVRGIR